MPFDPNGVFTRVNNTFSEPVLGQTIDPAGADALFNDYDAGLNADRGTSTTSLLIEKGSKAFVTQAEKNFPVGKFLLAHSAANAANFMYGQVTAYSGTLLTINVTAVGGSGTFADWIIDDSGGPTGIQDVTATSRFLGRISPGAGPVEELTGTQATTLLDAFTGDSGSGGVKGLVPAPAAGDGAAAKVLRADGTWATVAGTGDVTASSNFGTDNVAIRSDGTAKTVQASALLIADTTGALSRVGGGGIPVQGTNTNDNAASGDVGEFPSTVVTSGSGVALTNNVVADFATVSLGAGDWDVEAEAWFLAGVGTSASYFEGGINTTSATLPSAPAASTGRTTLGLWPSTSVSNSTVVVPIGRVRASLTGSTTYRLVGRSGFSGGTMTGFGKITARRVR